MPAQLDDFIAQATKSRWSRSQILEQLVQAEASERSRRSLERRLRLSGIKKLQAHGRLRLVLAHQDRTRYH